MIGQSLALSNGDVWSNLIKTKKGTFEKNIFLLSAY